jgi:hypothetical protein
MVSRTLAMVPLGMRSKFRVWASLKRSASSSLWLL